LTDKFSSIKPYSDHEVNEVLNSIIEKDSFINALLSQQNLITRFIPFSKFFLKKYLLRLIKDINSIDAYQLLYEKLIKDIISNKINNFQLSGLDNIDPKQNYLFISNHRDITLDPALLNYAIFQHGHKTFNIAIGDNLIKDSWVSDLMRLNKSFIIKRSGSSKKEIYKSLKLASEFIGYKILNSDESVWIAQRQGRAKDGIDATDSSILKMIYLSAKNDMSIGEYFNKLKIVPVSLSYEIDPNDISKANELSITNSNGHYKKSKNEDFFSIYNGIFGNKGNVSLKICKPINLDKNINFESIAKIIDKEIISGYKLHLTNYAAARLLSIEFDKNDLSEEELTIAVNEMTDKVSKLSDGVKKNLLLQYANPIIQKQNLV
tara:strand:- start:8171 stop:9301 length:1131 start_codon:yes stop_codon:yes gene_type:complete